MVQATLFNDYPTCVSNNSGQLMFENIESENARQTDKNKWNENYEHSINSIQNLQCSSIYLPIYQLKFAEV